MISWTAARSHLARAVQTGEPPEVIEELRRDYAAARLAHQIRTGAQGLTDQQRAELARLMLAGGEPSAS